MNSETNKMRKVELILTYSAAVFSLIGAIVVLGWEFGGINTGYPTDAYFCLFCSYLSGWSKLFLVLISLILFSCMGLTIALIFGIYKKTSEIKIKPINLYILLCAALALFIIMITIIIFARQVKIESIGGWWLEIGFYGSTICSILVIIFMAVFRILLSNEGEPSRSEEYS